MDMLICCIKWIFLIGKLFFVVLNLSNKIYKYVLNWKEDTRNTWACRINVVHRLSGFDGIFMKDGNILVKWKVERSALLCPCMGMDNRAVLTLLSYICCYLCPLKPHSPFPVSPRYPSTSWNKSCVEASNGEPNLQVKRTVPHLWWFAR